MIHCHQASKGGKPPMPDTFWRRSLTTEERFLSHVNKNGPLPTPHPELGRCWLWTGVTSKTNGYGHFWVGSHTDGSRQGVGAHRVAFELWRGVIPTGMWVHHLCRNARCVNPAHLQATTPHVHKGIAHKPTHCKRGHPFSPENTYLMASGSRACRTCRRLWKREHRRRQSPYAGVAST